MKNKRPTQSQAHQTIKSAKKLITDLKDKIKELDEIIKLFSEEREQIVSQLRDLIGEEEVPTQSKLGRPPGRKNEAKLEVFVERILSSSKSLSAGDIAKKILEQGYNTNSDKEGFAASVYQTLRKMVREGKLNVSQDKRYSNVA